MDRHVVIVSACRTPIGNLLGSLTSRSAAELGAVAIRGALERAGIAADEVDEVLMGCVLQAGAGQNIARQAAVAAGIPIAVTATTLNMVCGSGLKAVSEGMRSILAGDNDVVVVGGTESMSNVPYYNRSLRRGNKLGDVIVTDGLVADGLTDVFHRIHMGITAEKLAEQRQISRERQDRFAAESQRRAGAAAAAGLFDAEIVPVTVADAKGVETVVSRDEYPRPDTTAERLAKLRPAFQKDGTVTAGNASGINDGAAALVLMSAERAAAAGIRPLARIVAAAEAGVAPEIMGIGPVAAVRKALAKASLSVADIDLFEANEAFAAQSLAVLDELGLPEDRTNVNGGAIALGHPIGASGSRILVSLLHELVRRGGHRGLATLCIGGGMGICMIVERED